MEIYRRVLYTMLNDVRHTVSPFKNDTILRLECMISILKHSPLSYFNVLKTELLDCLCGVRVESDKTV